MDSKIGNWSDNYEILPAKRSIVIYCLTKQKRLESSVEPKISLNLFNNWEEGEAAYRLPDSLKDGRPNSIALGYFPPFPPSWTHKHWWNVLEIPHFLHMIQRKMRK